MSDSRVGSVGQAVLGRARDGETARRRAYYVRLEQVAELAELGWPGTPGTG